jgi:hypothetical protein
MYRHSLDAIIAFAISDPNFSSQSQSVFSGLVAHPVALLSGSPSLLRIGKVLFLPTLSAVDAGQLKQVASWMSMPLFGAILK